MNQFDQKAGEWDKNKMHLERSEAIAREILRIIPLKKQWTALEFGAGTGITSFLLKDHLKEITLMDNSAGMVAMINEKISSSGAKNLKVQNFDLEHSNYSGEKFNLLFTQMVLHHISDVGSIISKFRTMIHKDGYLAISDIYTEDGSFHGEGFSGHNGFDPGHLESILRDENFKIISSGKCFTIRKETDGGNIRLFDVFLIVARLD